MGLKSWILSKSKKSPVGVCAICNCEIEGIPPVGNNQPIVDEESVAILSGKEMICENCLKTNNLKAKKIKGKQMAEVLRIMKETGTNLPDEISKKYENELVFNPSKTIGKKFMGTYTIITLEIDERNRLIRFRYMNTQNIFNPEIKYSVRKMDDLVDFELLDNGTQTISGNSIMGATVGAITFGAVGALVGAGTPSKKVNNLCNHLKLKVVFNDISKPEEYITFISEDSKGIKRDSSTFKEVMERAQECISILTVVMKQNEKNNDNNTQSSSVIDAIKKLSELRDTGVLTEEEFQTKKKELLSRL